MNNHKSVLMLIANQVFAFGENDYGQLGIKGTQVIKEFTPIPGLRGKILKLFLHAMHAFILTSDGLFACGSNAIYQLGLGYIRKVETFTLVPGIEGKILNIATHHYFTLIHTTQGLYGCGNNYNGQLGFGNVDDVKELTTIPIPVASSQIRTLAVSNNFSVIATEDKLFGCGLAIACLGLNHSSRSVKKFTLLPGFNGSILNVVAGNHDLLVLTPKGLFARGANQNSQLGLSDMGQVKQFTLIPNLKGQILNILI